MECPPPKTLSHWQPPGTSPKWTFVCQNNKPPVTAGVRALPNDLFTCTCDCRVINWLCSNLIKNALWSVESWTFATMAGKHSTKYFAPNGFLCVEPTASMSQNSFAFVREMHQKLKNQVFVRHFLTPGPVCDDQSQAKRGRLGAKMTNFRSLLGPPKLFIGPAITISSKHATDSLAEIAP